MNSQLTIFGGVEGVRKEAMPGILRERGRGFASDGETWAELKLRMDEIASHTKPAESTLKEMYEAIREENRDAFAALLQNMERSAAVLVGDWLRVSVLAKIALEDPELPEADGDAD